MKTIGLIAAMPQERDALLRFIKERKQISMKSFRCDCFELSGQTCLLVTSGMGVRRASKAARNLVAIYAPRILISFGIAGAVKDDLQIGDVITAESVCLLDQGVIGQRLPLATWPENALQAAALALSKRNARLLPGVAITTSGSQVIEQILDRMTNPILEMETAGIAQVAAQVAPQLVGEKGIPFFSIRAISDGPRSPIPFDLGQMMDENANLKVSQLLKTIIKRPGILFQSKRMMQNTRMAADNAAIALLAVLSQSIF